MEEQLIDDDETLSSPSLTLETFSQSESLIFVPAVQSTYGDSDKSYTGQEDWDSDDDYDFEDADVEPDVGGSYNLRNQSRFHYYAMAHVKIVKDIDQPELGLL